MNGTGQSSGKLLNRLALDGYAERLCAVRVASDAFGWTRFCGSLSLVLVVMLFLSGAFLMFYYSPTPGAAYDSVDFAQFSVPFGDIVRGVHYYAWNLLLVVLGLHLAGTFLTAAYQAPRQFVWISGVLIMLVVPLFIITGDLLPWDQKGYWTTQVRNSIISSIPVVGDLTLRLLQGGPRTGIVTLTRFYVLHCLFLPSLLVALIVIHLHFLAHRGLSEPLREGKTDRGCIPLVPDLINRWLLLFAAVAVVLGLVSAYWPAPLDSPADPTDSAYVPKPEWWVLALNQLVSIFKGPFMFIGTAVIPGGLAALLIALPFLDRSPSRHPAKRKTVMVLGVIMLILLSGLSLLGYIEHFMTPRP
ncbi:cytochrome b [Syntrophobacter fumaroxidans]|uniref:Cytochrome b/b6, N-terminal domain n=1 Tax=Syntrophobacter fumaroxidans (strain DSM 10017 / MPOB) TaxID=335543 RepID=A0LFE3_SYNFM|nr:cytochrome b [Syntrophobacter fumaroxidans]ABK16145.1 Cytochrome b/b6, N-terminal domain [Syntrophobacter fumaroxidans MPOB]